MALPEWPNARIWRHPSGVYVVLEASPAVVDDRHDRMAPGLNHLALRVADRYPQAGGPDHTALFLENAEDHWPSLGVTTMRISAGGSRSRSSPRSPTPSADAGPRRV